LSKLKKKSVSRALRRTRDEPTDFHVVTFKLLTHEWLRNPARVAAAQEARRLAGCTSAAASAARAAALGVFSSSTGRPDGMGMNIAGGAAEVQAQALEYGLTPAEVAQAARGPAGYFSAVVSEVRAENLGIISDNSGRGDGMCMIIAGGGGRGASAGPGVWLDPG